MDPHLLGEGRHERLSEALGGHLVDGGVRFAVWAPDAIEVSVIGDFNHWTPGEHPLAHCGSSGVWAGFVPKLGEGTLYKYSIRGKDGSLREKCDPLAHAMELP